MNLAWCGYTCLRRDLMAPINNIDQYVPAVIDLKALNGGNMLHWMPLKRLVPNCEWPPADADKDEILAHQSVIHYGDSLKILGQHVNNAPVVERQAWLDRHPFDYTKLPVVVPHIDVCIVESSGQIGGGYVIDEWLKVLFRRNPNIGFVVIDQDLSGATVVSKMRKWHPNPFARMIFASYHPVRKYNAQAFLPPSHPVSRENHKFVTDKYDICYVGNDYHRREAMMRLLRYDRSHVYGRFKPDFYREMMRYSTQIHGPLIPGNGYSVESTYREHGIGLQLARDDYAQLHLLTPRISEVVRAGCVCFCDRVLQVAIPLLGGWAMVGTHGQMLEKIDDLKANPDLHGDMIGYQLDRVRQYLHSDRYSMTLWKAAKRLHEGPITTPFYVSEYDDLLEVAGLRPWREYNA